MSTLSYALVIIKPDAIQCCNEIIQIVRKEGFHILARKRFHLLPEQAAEFLNEFEQLKYFMLLVYNLSNGPIEVLIVAKDNCIEDLDKLLGFERPSMARLYSRGSLRAIYGSKFDDLQNAIHGSKSHKDAIREIHFFFPNFIVDPISKDDSKMICCKAKFVETLLNGLQKMPVENESILKLANWWLKNDPDYPVIDDSPISDEKSDYYYSNVDVKEQKNSPTQSTETVGETAAAADGIGTGKKSISKQSVSTITVSSCFSSSSSSADTILSKTISNKSYESSTKSTTSSTTLSLTKSTPSDLQ